MLCWVAAEKVDPNSNSNWLERLRSNKGFPMGDELGLDHFLTQQNLDNPNPSPDCDCECDHPNANSSSSSSSSFLLITGILSDLFNITTAPSKSFPKNKIKKFPRKQSNPKLFPIINPSPPPPPNNNNNNHNILSSNSDNTSNPNPNALQHEDQVFDDDDDDKDKQLVGYSKSEVTVIDTSCDLWKSDKLLFRRNNVWKVKDKKGKSRTYARKKRAHLIPDTWGSGSHHPFHFSLQQLPPNHSLQPFNKGYNPQYCCGPEISANAPDSGNNDKKENAYTVLPENGSYDTEKNGSM